MTPGAERLLVLSIRLFKTAANRNIESERKGVLLQNLTVARQKILHDISPDDLSLADKARLELAGYLGRVAAHKVKFLL